MKCPKCGLMQGPNPRCKRCGNPFQIERRAAAPPGTRAKPMAADNPYAPPIVSDPGPVMSGGAAGELFRDGDFLVARDGAPFPDRCVRCNQSAQGFRLKKTFYWHPPSWYLLILVSILIYAVVAMVVRKKASFHLALCPQHRSRRRLLVGLGLGLPLLGLSLVLLTGGDPASLWGLFIGILVGAIVGIVGAQILTPKKIEDGYAYLKGAHPRFLASLPALR